MADKLDFLLFSSQTKTGVCLLFNKSTQELHVRTGCCGKNLALEEDEDAELFWYCLGCGSQDFPRDPVTDRMSIAVVDDMLSKWVSEWTGFDEVEFELKVEVE
jgi:hypothetical protein